MPKGIYKRTQKQIESLHKGRKYAWTKESINKRVKTRKDNGNYVMPEHRKKQISQTNKRKGIKPKIHYNGPAWNKGLKGIHLSSNTEFKKGQKAWNFIHGKSFIYPYEYRKIRQTIINLYGKCQICRNIGSDIHHIDYNKNNNDITNLIYLCKKCHMKTNYNRKDWKDYFINKCKKILITGSDGLIGSELLEQLEKTNSGCVLIRCFDIKRGFDIRDYRTCNELIKGIDECYSLFGIKGNPKMTKEKPVDFIGPMLQGDTNMILSAQKYKVKRFLYTSSIAVEYPENDWFPAWAKRTGEELIKAMRVQYPNGTKYCIVRPANVYGRFDNFDNPNLMVVSKLIKEAKSGKIILDVEGAKQIRDLISAKDVARGMIKAIRLAPCNEPFNLCTGKGVSINKLANIISKVTGAKLIYKNLNLTLGPSKKIMERDWNNPLFEDLEENIQEIWNTIN